MMQFGTMGSKLYFKTLHKLYLISSKIMDFILEDIYSKHNTSFAPITHILDFEVYCVEGLIPLAYYVFLFSNKRKSGLKEWFVLVKN